MKRPRAVWGWVSCVLQLVRPASGTLEDLRAGLEVLDMNEGEDPRVRFAAERTLLAWIRTGLALMGFGFVLARFSFVLRELSLVEHKPSPQSPGLSLWFGTALV